jgi:hypothetical protein
MSEPPRRKTLPQSLRLLVTSWKVAVGFLAGLGVILGFVFHPPWGGGSSSSASDTKTTTLACPGVSEGRISKVSTDAPIRLDAYWDLHPGSREKNVSKARLRSLGRVVHFRVELNGYRGKDLTVWWWMLTPNGAPVPEPTLRRQLAFGLTPHDCTTGGAREIWAELPKRNGRFRVEVQLVDPGGEQLDFARTKPFAVTKPRS